MKYGRITAPRVYSPSAARLGAPPARMICMHVAAQTDTRVNGNGNGNVSAGTHKKKDSTPAAGTGASDIESDQIDWRQQWCGSQGSTLSP